MKEVTFCSDYATVKKMVTDKIWLDFEKKKLDFWVMTEDGQTIAYKYKGKGFVNL